MLKNHHDIKNERVCDVIYEFSLYLEYRERTGFVISGAVFAEMTIMLGPKVVHLPIFKVDCNVVGLKDLLHITYWSQQQVENVTLKKIAIK